jgi:hypothetical protein
VALRGLVEARVAFLISGGAGTGKTIHPTVLPSTHACEAPRRYPCSAQHQPQR